ncbi:helix-turn-helix domain-containing protein [Streptomyces sp. NBC_01236]|uniref:helix-turn-helix domain-containing protein n=1 Tax=Streptomyces sp. NBC_01236 TaxID=2903789 RepID=UPI002E14C8A5|nr:helix-turn-helix domain-containing protein [Streptomyces sp. NBC_01236]
MSAWQPLPEQLPTEVRHFVEQLRRLKDSTGLSLVALGARTAYSKSSWQRYLNATQPPPRQAVVALCRVAGLGGADTERFGVRWELAVRVWPRVPVSVGPSGDPSGDPSAGSPADASVDPSADPPAGPSARPYVRPSFGEPIPDMYEDDPTLPWWDVPEVPESKPATGRLLIYTALFLLALLLVALAGAVTLG